MSSAIKLTLARGVRVLKARVAARIAEPFSGLSFSQEGEDRVLLRLFEQRLDSPGFYVDVGAHHPARFSNTYLFYKGGWHGINLDATPGSMAEFERVRPRDRNLEIAIAESSGTLTLHCFSEPALNTFSEDLAQSYLALPNVRRVATREIACQSLASVLRSEVPTGRSIDFLNVDVEGLDLQVLRSNDWERYRPQIVLVESLETNMSALGDNPSVRFMTSVAYTVVAKTVNTLFFRDDRAARFPHAA